MPKILFINDYKIGGGAEQVVLQTIELLKDTYDIDYFYGSEIFEQPNNILDYIYSNKYYKLLLDKLNNTKPNIIHIANYYHLLSPSILQAIKIYKQTNSIKVVMTTHDFHILAPNSGFTSFSWYGNKINKLKKNPTLFDVLIQKWDHRGIHYSITKQLQWIYAYKIKKLDTVIDTFISPSNFVANFLKQKYPKKHIFVIRNPLPDSFSTLHYQTTSHSDHLNLIYVGRISSEKGLNLFLTQLKKIKKIKYTFTVVGDGEQLIHLKQLLKNSNIQNNIIFKGRLAHRETLKEMSNKDILVLPSILYENAPLSLVEGALNGLKILTMNYGGMKEIAEICGNYYLLNENIDNLEKGLLYLKDHNFTDYTNKINSIFLAKNYTDRMKEIYE